MQQSLSSRPRATCAVQQHLYQYRRPTSAALLHFHQLTASSVRLLLTRRRLTPAHVNRPPAPRAAPSPYGQSQPPPPEQSSATHRRPVPAAAVVVGSLVLAAAALLLAFMRAPGTLQAAIAAPGTGAPIALVCDSPTPTSRTTTAALAATCTSTLAGQPAALASISAAQLLLQPYASFREAVAYVNYKVMQAMTLPTWGKVLTVLAVAIPILIAGSVTLCAFTGLSPRAAVLRCYYILNNVPGIDITAEEDTRAGLVLNLLYTVGLLTFAVLIGVLGEDIGSAVQAARLGNSPVPERNHTVVLGYNRQLVEVLRQVECVRRERGGSAFPGQLVVLSELDRETLDGMLLEKLGPRAAARVVTRQGSPLQVSDLQLVSAGHAKTVILLAPENADEGHDPEEAAAQEPAAVARGAWAAAESSGGSPAAAGGGGGGDDGGASAGGHCLTLEAQQAVTLAALHHLRRQALDGPAGFRLGAEPQTVVVQHDADLGMLDPGVYGGVDGWDGADGRPADGGGGASRGGGGTHVINRVSHLNSLSRIQAQCAAQPGLSVVMSSLLQQMPNTPEFYVQHYPQLTGLTYGDARRLFRRAVLCGVYDPSASAEAIAATSPDWLDAGARMSAEASAVVLNPPDSLPLLDCYSLILLAHNGKDLAASAPPKITDVGGGGRTAQSLTQSAPANGPISAGSGDSGGSTLATDGGSGGGGLGLFRGGVIRRLLRAARRSRLEAEEPRLRVVVLAFDGRWPGELLDALEDYCAAGSEAIIVAAEGSEAARGCSVAHSRQGQGQQGQVQQGQQGQRLRVRTVVGDPRTRGALKLAEATEATSVIIAGLTEVPTDQADAQALATLLQLQALIPPASLPPPFSPPPLPPPLPAATAAASTAPTPSAGSAVSDAAAGGYLTPPSPPPLPPPSPALNLVCCVTDPRVRSIMTNIVEVQRQQQQQRQAAAAAAHGVHQQGPPGRQEAAGRGWMGGRRAISLDLITADELLAGVLTQVAAEPRLSGLFHELSSVEGMEVYLRSPGSLGLPLDSPLDWDQVQEAGRSREATVIGVLQGRGGAARSVIGGSDHGGGSGAATEADGQELLLGVPRGRGAVLQLREGDKLVVLARN